MSSALTANALLPLVTFEKYMLCDDAPLYPMTCHIRFWFDKAPEKEALGTAFLGALELHPLLSARLERSGLRRGYRLLPPLRESLPKILDYAPDTTELQVRPQPHDDLRVRLIVRKAGAPDGPAITHSPDGRGVILLVQFHHAITDGIGIFDFIEDLLLLYNREIVRRSGALAETAPSPPPRRRELLKDRGRFHLTLFDWWRRIRWDLARYRGFFRRQPTPLRLEGETPGASPSPVRPGMSPLDAAVREVWSAERTKAFSAEAKTQGVTLNDLLLTRYFRALLEWQGPKQGPIRVSVPTSLRLPADAELPSTNVVSMCFLDRTEAIIRDPAALLASIATEMRRIKDQRLGLAMIRILTWFARLPGVLSLFFRLPVCQTTSVLTNLGRPFAGSPLMGQDGLVRAGDVTMTGVDTLPPVRPLTTVSLSVNGYAGKLSMTLRYDGRLMSRAAASRILSLISRTFEGEGEGR